ncbi:MAG TPA: hypothetical protein PLM14_13500 [Candidatus Hydrogenedentes bacterium]|nr:hypothetical protein [Candidatus Hydrogenedentota bacterium]HQE84011.1 hypothetical protein [Candidatus Hydrogenedentota bacterium]HQH51044.1 hypothetical protein [Candidatus Hydrogenedentota bacterium]HQM48766.1 hypothetical protein [Candidatus Hydrogenedentota bacterium]
MLRLVNSASYGAAVLLAFLAAALFVTLVVAYALRFRGRRTNLSKTRAPQNDIINTMIMFQTMRDILEQQKDVARQLNVSLGKKVKYIKTVVETAAADLREMRETARRVAVELAETKAELAAVQARLGQRGGTPSGEDAGRADIGAMPLSSAEEHQVSAHEQTLEASSRPVLEEPPDTGLDHWVGLDFGEVPEEPESEPAETPPETPEHAEAARNAFRALLNLDTAPGEPKTVSADSEKNNGKGRSSAAPLKKRVYEYNDAGMSVSEIARELGLGKGEVRLILNLRKDRGE